MTQIVIGKSGYGKTTYAKKLTNQNYIFLDICSCLIYSF